MIIKNDNKIKTKNYMICKENSYDKNDNKNLYDNKTAFMIWLH